MKNLYKTISVLVLMALILPTVVLAQFTVTQGGTGQTSFTANRILYGGTSLRLGSEAAFNYDPATNILTVTNASTTALSATSVCLSSDCRTSWPTSGGGGGGISTSTTPTPGHVAFWTSEIALSSVATGTLTESATGLEFNATRGLLGGAAILSLTSGYNIPLTASTTEWAAASASTTALTPSYIRGLFSNTATGLTYSNTTGITSLTANYVIPLSASTTEWHNFHTTPSGRITAGTGIDWSGNTLNGVYTAGDALTLNGEDFDFDGGATPSGDLGGTWASPSVTNDSHDHTGATLSGIDISSDTNLSADGVEIILTGDALSLGTALTFTTGTSSTSFFSALGTFTNAVINTLLTAVAATFTGLVDIGGGSLEIPNGTNPTIDAVGEIGLDTSGNQLIVGTSTTAAVVPVTDVMIWSATIASTSPRFLSAGLYPVPTKLDGYTITRIQCHVTSGTSTVIAVEDASGNSSEDITCATTNTTDDGSITNPVYTASELSYIDFGATVGAVDYVSISVFGNWTRE